MSSSMNNNPVPSGEIETTIIVSESSWTPYLEDYSYDPDQSSFSTPSMVSDAASYAAWKIFAEKNQFKNLSDLNPSEFPRRLNMKKQPRRRGSYDKDLEDTASSPVNSPKVSGVMRQDNTFGNFLGTSPFSGENGSIIKYDEVEKKKNHSTGLRKRGLCVMPVSVLMNN